MEEAGTEMGRKDGRKGTRRGGEVGKVSTYLYDLQQNLLVNIVWLPMSVMYDNVHMHVILIVNLPPE